jgi:hypothetical protein
MKPRIILAEAPMPDGSALRLEEHDGRMSLLIHGQQICGPATRAAEEELARRASRNCGLPVSASAMHSPPQRRN